MNYSRTVLVFGTFDGVHEGHRFFLRAARAHASYVLASVAQDKMVYEFKGRYPDRCHEVRMRELQSEGLADELQPGDSEIGAWSIVRKRQPEVIAFGYDQTALAEALQTADLGYVPELVWIDAYHPDRYHTRILRTQT